MQKNRDEAVAKIAAIKERQAELEKQAAEQQTALLAAESQLQLAKKPSAMEEQRELDKAMEERRKAHAKAMEERVPHRRFLPLLRSSLAAWLKEDHSEDRSCTASDIRSK